MRLFEVEQNPIEFDPADGYAKIHIGPREVHLIALYAARKGGGARMLKRVIAYADAHVLPIRLEADGDDRLVAYYERFGFQQVNTHSNTMIRDATGLETGRPRQILDGLITYDARDGALSVKFADLDDKTAVWVTKLEEKRPGGAGRMLLEVLDFGQSQMYPVATKLPLDDGLVQKYRFQRHGNILVKPYR